MKYIKLFNEAGEWKDYIFYKFYYRKSIDDDIKDILLPVTDNDLNIISVWNVETLSIQIVNEWKYLAFNFDDYVDEVERVIDYLRNNNFIYRSYEIYEDAASDERPTFNRRREGVDLMDLHGKKCSLLTLIFNNPK